jgi:hypothetical protein
MLQQRKVISKKESVHDLDSLLAVIPMTIVDKHLLQTDKTKHQSFSIAM